MGWELEQNPAVKKPAYALCLYIEHETTPRVGWCLKDYWLKEFPQQRRELSVSIAFGRLNMLPWTVTYSKMFEHHKLALLGRKDAKLGG